MRGIFFSEDAARAVEQRLISDGFTAGLSRERFAGEDDDEDHPWAVVTDAPDIALEILVDRYDGWLDDEVVSPPAVPLVLPDAPKRLHRPEG